MSEADTGECLTLFQEAQVLANRGDVDEALLTCHRYLSLYGPTAKIYFLMGMLNVAERRDNEAASYFQKAVYLEPTHYDGLVNLALLATRRGEPEAAERFWKRARKLSTTGSDR